MNVDYKILWIDDQPDNVQEHRDYISNRLARRGFALRIEMLDGQGSRPELKNKLKKRIRSEQGVDLVLVDYKLGEGNDCGDVIARLVRALARGTDIIFYSASPPADLRKKIAAQDIDGVYCANRPRLGEVVWNVIQANIKKALDLNGLRGIVMNAVADFDYTIDAAIEKVFARMDEPGRTRLRDRILDLNCRFHAGKLDDLARAERKTDISDYLNLLASDQKHRELCRLLDEFYDDPDLERCIEVLESYNQQVIRPRNELAHGRAIRRGDDLVIANRGKEIPFTEDRFVGILSNLAEHEENLKRLTGLLARLPELSKPR